MPTSNPLLIVEDDDAIREALAEVLEIEGYQVARAADGQDALEQLRAGLRPFLILLDVTMPRMDGYQFRAAQRSDPSLASIPVVVISADGRVAQKASALDTPHYMSKPVKLEPLLALLSAHESAG